MIFTREILNVKSAIKTQQGTIDEVFVHITPYGFLIKAREMQCTIRISEVWRKYIHT